MTFYLILNEALGLGENSWRVRAARGFRKCAVFEILQKQFLFISNFTFSDLLNSILFAQTLPYARVCSKFTAWIEKPSLEDGAEEPLPAGYRPVEFRWKHLDRCSVCYLDEASEYGTVHLFEDK